MTLSNTKVKVTYLGDGQNRRFDVPFAVLDAADLAVFITGPDGELKRVESGFSVSADKTFITIPQNADKPALQKDFKITIMRQTPATQENDLIQQAVLHKESLETSLDKLTMIAQEIQERLSRTVTIGPDENADGVSVEELVAQMRELYAQIKTEAQNASEEAQKAIAAAVEAYEQAEKLYSNVEYYTAGTAALDYTGDLQTFKLYESYKADGYSLKVFVNGLLKRRGEDYDYTEIINPELQNKGEDYSDTVHFNTPLTPGDTVCFMWGDTLTMPGGEVAQEAALSAETAGAYAQAAAAAAEDAKQSAGSFIPKPIGEVYYSQSGLAKDNPGAVPGWTGQVLTQLSQTWPGLLDFVKEHPERQISASEYTAMMNAKKQCPFYVLDETADTLKLPTYSRFIAAVREDGVAGAFADTMRPITGKFASVDRGGDRGYKAAGAFAYDSRYSLNAKSGSGDDWGLNVSMDSAKLGAHYNGEETLPAHVREYPWIVAANCVPDIIKHPSGIYSTEDLDKALAQRPTRGQADELYAPKDTTYSKTDTDNKIADAIAGIDTSNLASKDYVNRALADRITKQEAEGKFALKTDIPQIDLSGYAPLDEDGKISQDLLPEDAGFTCLIRDYSGDETTPEPPKPSLAVGDEIRSWYVAATSPALKYTASDGIEYSTKRLYSATQQAGDTLYYDRAMLYPTPYTLVQTENGFCISGLDYGLGDNGPVMLGKATLVREGYQQGQNLTVYGPAEGPAIGDVYKRVGGALYGELNTYQYMGYATYGTVSTLNTGSSSDFSITTSSGDALGFLDRGKKELEVIPMKQWYCAEIQLGVLTFMQKPQVNTKVYPTVTAVQEGLQNAQAFFVQSVNGAEDGSAAALVIDGYTFTPLEERFDYIGPKGDIEL